MSIECLFLVSIGAMLALGWLGTKSLLLFDTFLAPVLLGLVGLVCTLAVSSRPPGIDRTAGIAGPSVGSSRNVSGTVPTASGQLSANPQRESSQELAGTTQNQFEDEYQFDFPDLVKGEQSDVPEDLGVPEIPKKESPEVVFFQTRTKADSVAYVVDCSGSMQGRKFQRAFDELTRSIARLQPEQRFYVSFFHSSAVPMFDDPNPSSPSRNTPAVRTRLEQWMQSVQAGGGTNPETSLQIASRLSPDAVFLLSDGDFNPLSSGTMQTFRDKKISVHTIAYESSSGATLLKRIADATGGTYRFVSASASILRIDFVDRLSPVNAGHLRMIANGHVPEQWEIVFGARQAGPVLLEEMIELLRDPDHSLRRDVRDILLHVTGRDPHLSDTATMGERENVIREWREWFSAESRDGFRHRLVGTASRERLKLVAEMVSSPNVHERVVAASYVGQRPDRRLVDHLLTLVADPEPDVRRPVQRRLVKLAGRDLGPSETATEEQRRRSQSEWRQWWNLESAASRLTLARQLYDQGRFDAARDRLEALVAEFPGSTVATDAHALLGASIVRRRRQWIERSRASTSRRADSIPPPSPWCYGSATFG